MDWHFQWGNVFLTDNSATVDRILMILMISAGPHDISILIKISPLARLQARARKLRIARIANFCQFRPIFAKKCFVFSESTFFPLSASTCNFQGSISNVRGAFEPKTHPYNPKIWPKMCPGDLEMGQFFLTIFSKGQ